MRFGYYERLSHDERRVYDASDAVKAFRLPRTDLLFPKVEALKAALGVGKRGGVQASTTALVDALCEQFEVKPVRVQVHASRPSSKEAELHGLYTMRPRVPLIQVWMKTAKLGRVVAFRTFLRTVLHEVCHHLDIEFLALPLSFHTQGFYQRESSLFHQLVPGGRTLPPRPEGEGAAPAEVATALVLELPASEG